MIRGIFRTGLLFLFALLLASSSWAATYYVAKTGTDAWPGCSQGSPCLTIDYVADRASAGDTIRVQTGTYVETITPAHNGTSPSSMITFVADSGVTVCNWDVSNNTYLRIIGFTIDCDTDGCSGTHGITFGGSVSTSTGIEVWNNTIKDCCVGIRGSYQIANSGSCNSCLFIGNYFENMRCPSDPGSAMAISFTGNDCLIAHNEINGAYPDVFGMFSARNRWINNYTRNCSEDDGGHSDIFQTGSNDWGWSDNLIEGHFQVGMGDLGNEHTAQISNNQAVNCTGGTCAPITKNVIRRNVFHNVSTGTIGINQAFDEPVDYTYYYNNTEVFNVRNYADTRYSPCWYSALLDDSFIFNNLFYEAWGTGVSANLEVYYVGNGAVTHDYNLAYDPDGAVTFLSGVTYFGAQAHGQGNVNPALSDVGNDNFVLGLQSGASNTAGALTIVTSPSGTGTAFAVGNAGFFKGDNSGVSQYAGALIVGDTILVGTDTVVISAISGNTITASSSFTWASGESVYYGTDATPDIGAYPYKAGGYALTATYTNSGGNITVTPSDAELVRWVICYDDGIPTTVDNSSPYTCSVSGTPTVKVYSLYPSKTPVINATLDSDEEVGKSETGFGMTGGSVQ